MTGYTHKCYAKDLLEGKVVLLGGYQILFHFKLRFDYLEGGEGCEIHVIRSLGKVRTPLPISVLCQEHEEPCEFCGNADGKTLAMIVDIAWADKRQVNRVIAHEECFYKTVHETAAKAKPETFAFKKASDGQ